MDDIDDMGDVLDYWEVSFATGEHLEAARALIPISAEQSPHVALVADTVMDEDEIVSALEPLLKQGASVIVTPSDIRREDFWPSFPEDEADDDDALSP